MSTDTRTAEERRRNVPETLRLRDVGPALTVNDLERSLSWYRDIVGFVVKETWEHEGEIGGYSLVAGVGNLMLVKDDFAKGHDRDKGQGLRLFLSTAQNVDEIAENIKARGGELASEPADMPWGGRAFNLVDPDGFQLTIVGESS